MLHWIAVQMALIDTSDVAFTLICSVLLLMAALAWIIVNGREKGKP